VVSEEGAGVISDEEVMAGIVVAVVAVMLEVVNVISDELERVTGGVIVEVTAASDVAEIMLDGGI
jgi:hypothetical protein